ncbi:hypothetical protein DCC85_01270 [Paenibacillus sp. CAA11]|uniref:hypothetical protein n=1 Tax=Paenibacillus sp. CAA11 TaxID=1532905 RepID=UPI000D3B7905|nr:hypothetical protein [Paenibacillus sp. CAA11]AWB42994.1 hypothetical protein DCC85_01270 [Paenibacillus sp. CAA11]
MKKKILVSLAALSLLVLIVWTVDYTVKDKRFERQLDKESKVLTQLFISKVKDFLPLSQEERKLVEQYRAKYTDDAKFSQDQERLARDIAESRLDQFNSYLQELREELRI